MEFTLFFAAMVWAAIAGRIAGQAAAGISGRLSLSYGQSLLESTFLLFLSVIGFQALDWLATRGGVKRDVLLLPRRKTASREIGTGIAVGWALCLAAVLPALLSGHFHATLNHGVGVAPGILAAVLTLLAAALTEEVVFRGYPYQRLMRAIGTSAATLVLSALFAAMLVAANPPRDAKLALVDGLLFGLLLAMAYLRTHALWLGWGLHFGYRVVMAVVLGLPIVGRSDFGSLMDGDASGPQWLSGGSYGLDGGLLTIFVLLGGMVLVYRVTRDWAWAYTLPEIVPGGYEVVVAPPAAHVAMERSTAVAPPPLVQIAPVTPQSFSAIGKERSGSGE